MPFSPLQAAPRGLMQGNEKTGKDPAALVIRDRLEMYRVRLGLYRVRLGLYYARGGILQYAYRRISQYAYGSITISVSV